MNERRDLHDKVIDCWSQLLAEVEELPDVWFEIQDNYYIQIGVWTHDPKARDLKTRSKKSVILQRYADGIVLNGHTDKHTSLDEIREFIVDKLVRMF